MTNHEATIGVFFNAYTVPLEDCDVKFEIWDTAGQERFHSFAPLYYRGADTTIVVYDITNNVSYNAAKSWIEEVRKQGNINTKIMLVGNKTDLEDCRAVDSNVAEKYANENNFLFVETSAKNNCNVQKIFEMLAEIIPKNSLNEKYDLQIQEPNAQRNRSYYCCNIS